MPLIYQLGEAARPGGHSREADGGRRNAQRCQCIGNTPGPVQGEHQCRLVRPAALLTEAADSYPRRATGERQIAQSAQPLRAEESRTFRERKQNRAPIGRMGLRRRRRRRRRPYRGFRPGHSAPVDTRYIRPRRSRSRQAQAFQRSVRGRVGRTGRQFWRGPGLRQILLHRQPLLRGERRRRRRDRCQIRVGQVISRRGLPVGGDIATFGLVV